MKSRVNGLLLGLILIFALVRLQAAQTFTLEWDETNELALAKLPDWIEIIRVNAIREYHPPIFPMLLHTWIQIFGDSDFWVHNFTWLWGMLGVWASYLLALQISRSIKTALAVMALTVFSPFLWHYCSITTFYSMYYALVLFSWYFLLKYCQPAHRESRQGKGLTAGTATEAEISPRGWQGIKTRLGHWGWLAGYGLTSFVALYTHAAGPVFMVFQVPYVIYYFRTGPLQRSRLIWLVITWMLFIAGFLPFAWLIQQPWHISNVIKHPPNYQIIPFWMFLTSPVNLLFLGYDVRDLPNFPRLFPFVLMILLTGWLLWQGGQTLKRRQVFLLLCIGVFPLVLMYGASLAEQNALFQYRALLFSIFTFHFIIARFLRSKFNAKIACMVLIVLMALQYFNPLKRPFWPDTGSILAAHVKAGFQPGDGIIFYPGWMSLVFMRYFDPTEFGLTDRERHFNPLRENFNTQPQRIDSRYFIVSGESTLQRPEIRAAFRRFETRHARIWVVSGYEKSLFQQFDCQRIYFLLNSDASFQPVRCKITSQE